MSVFVFKQLFPQFRHPISDVEIKSTAAKHSLFWIKFSNLSKNKVAPGLPITPGTALSSCFGEGRNNNQRPTPAQHRNAQSLSESLLRLTLPTISFRSIQSVRSIHFRQCALDCSSLHNTSAQ